MCTCLTQMRKVNNSILHHISNLTTIFLEKQSIASKQMIVFFGHPSKSNDLLVSVFIRRPLTILIYIFNFLKTTKPIAAIFNLKHCYGRRNLNCEIQNLPSLGPHGRAKKGQNFKNLLLYTYTCGIKINAISMVMISMKLST